MVYFNYLKQPHMFNIEISGLYSRTASKASAGYALKMEGKSADTLHDNQAN